MAAAAKKSDDLVVSAPLVTVRTKAGADRQLYRGDVVGDDVTKESVDHLRDLGFVSDESDSK
jgi:hypothetical protein